MEAPRHMHHREFESLPWHEELMPPEPIEMMNWGPWLSEVIVGIESPNEDIAANYIRQTAIEFCRQTRVLKRVQHIRHSPRIYIEAPKDEQIVGVAGIASHDPCGCAWLRYGGSFKQQTPYRFDERTSELFIFEPFLFGRCGRGEIQFYTAPTEFALQHDRKLYDKYRMPIAQEARRAYATAVHFRDKELMASVQDRSAWLAAMAAARNQAVVITNNAGPNSARRGFI